MTFSLQRASALLVPLSLCFSISWLGCDDRKDRVSDYCDESPILCELDADQPLPPRVDAGMVGQPVPCNLYQDQDGDRLGDPNSEPKECFGAPNPDDPEPFCKTNDTDDCGVCGGKGPATWYADRNMDGAGDWTNETATECMRPAGFVSAPPRMIPDGCVLSSDKLSCVESATCNSNCTSSNCGDGVVNTTAGEACELDAVQNGSYVNPYVACFNCKANPGWTKPIARADASDRVRGVCMTQSDEIYVATTGRVLKYNMSGELLWDLATSTEGAIAHIACHAEHGVAAVGTPDLWVRRWLPNGTPAWATLRQAGAGSGKRIALRGDGNIVAAGVDGAADTFVRMFSAAGEALGTEPTHYIKTGDPLALIYPATGVPRMLTHRNAGSVGLPNAELRLFPVGSAMVGSLQQVQDLTAYEALIFDDFRSFVVGSRFPGNGRVSYTQHFTSGFSSAWVFKENGPIDRCVTASSGGVVVGRQSGGYLRLTEVNLEGVMVRDLFTMLAYEAAGVAQASDKSVVVAGTNNTDMNLFVTRIDFDRMARAKPLVSNGGACQLPAECLSQQCLDKVCEATGTANGGACKRNENCSSRFCLNSMCEAVGLATGATCKDARQCSSALCVAGKCN